MSNKNSFRQVSLVTVATVLAVAGIAASIWGVVHFWGPGGFICLLWAALIIGGMAELGAKGEWGDVGLVLGIGIGVPAVLVAIYLVNHETEEAIKKAHVEQVRRDSEKHAERLRRIKSGECWLVGPGSEVKTHGSYKYQHVSRTDFAIYECSDKGIFKMPLE